MIRKAPAETPAEAPAETPPRSPLSSLKKKVSLFQDPDKTSGMNKSLKRNVNVRPFLALQKPNNKAVVLVLSAATLRLRLQSYQ